MTFHSSVVILDYGSQYTQLITRRVRELGIYARILPGDASLIRIQESLPSAILLSGGPSSVYDRDAPQLPEGFLAYQAANHIPVLGICYGMQLLVNTFHGKVKKAGSREYGRMQVQPFKSSLLFPENQPFQAWMSHGDEAAELPAGFQSTARSAAGSIAAIENGAARLYGLQFHPEVTHTETGTDILKRFLFDIADLKPDWNMESVLEEQVQLIRDQVGPSDHVICALSGGVDSAVAAALVHRAVGDRLHCFFVDHGLLRLQEGDRVMELFKNKLHLPVTRLDHSVRYLKKLEGVSDPEQKRKIIGLNLFKALKKLLS